MPHEAVENQNRLVGLLYQRPFNFRKLLGPSAHGWFLSLKDICITEFKALYRFFEVLNAFPDMFYRGHARAKHVVGITRPDCIVVLYSEADTELLVRAGVVLLG